MPTAADPGPCTRLKAPPKAAKGLPRIRKLAEVRPDRLVWALNLPHPQFPAHCLDILLEAFPDDPAMQKAILADNPAKLYDFPD